MKKIISLLFLFSGIAGLIYEVVWAKHLALFLGNTTQAHTIVLATFMGGLALGYYLFGKIADKGGSALSLYGWMEMGIGLSGLLFVPLLGWFGSTYISMVTHFGLDSVLAAAFKFLLSILLLLLPTILMGGTLPVLSRFVVRSLGQVESEVGRLYFLNSFGAVGGSLLAGLVLIPRFGLNLSITVAVALSLLVGLMALALRSWDKSERETRASQTTVDNSIRNLYTPWQIRIAIMGVALSGGAALIYEIAWIRLLSLVLGSSTFSFSLMLAAFIAGIALGSFIVSKKWVLRFEPYHLFALAELGVALSILLTLPLYERLPFYFAVLANLFVRAPETFWLYELTQFFICFLLMLLPTLFLGMTLPLVSQVAARSLKRLGENIGNVFAANTAGTLIGAVAAGLLLLPLLGIKGLIEVGILINLIVGAFALWVGPGLTLKKKALTLGTSFGLFVIYFFLFPAWDQNILSSGTFRLRGFYAGVTYADFKKGWKDEILYYKDGANMTVAVSKGKDSQIILKLNGKPDASSQGDLPTQILLGQIPLLLKPDARSVLVIGLGSGITAGSVLRHPVERVDLVEISPEVVEGSRFFSPHNHDALKDPRLKLHIEDGKTFLKVTPQHYSVIISEPSNPWIAGIGNLFSVEFYQDVRKRLEPSGLVVQWFHTYEMTDETLRLLLRTFTASFEHVTLWSPVATDLLLIGSKAPLSTDFKKSLARFEDTKVRGELKRLGIKSFSTILSLQVASDEGVRTAVGRGRVNEDLFPVLEHEAPKAFFLGRVSRFLVSYDERRLPRNGSPLFFAQYLEKFPLGRKEKKDITLYHLTYGSLTRLDLARNFVELWLRQAPRDPEAHWALARIEEGLGNLEAARKAIQYLLEHNPNNREYLEAAARLEFQAYLKRRSLVAPRSAEKALSYLHQLLRLENSKRDRIYRDIARIYAADRDYKSAISYLEKAAAYAQNNEGVFQPDTHWLEAAGMALEIGDVETGLVLVRKVLVFDPENNAAKKSLRELSQLTQTGPNRKVLLLEGDAQ
jgi:predicted membrane-bound spermidine synthase